MILNVDLNGDELECILCALDELMEADASEASYHEYNLSSGDPELIESLRGRIETSRKLYDKLQTRILSLKGV